MKWSFKLGRFLGIDLYLHLTLLLFLAFISFQEWNDSHGHLKGTVVHVGTFVAMFVCVVLHEYGHVLAARKFGIPTRDITLYPIGGVARLERMPKKPMEEFIIAIAGPAVNLVIVIILLFFVPWNWDRFSAHFGTELIPRLLVANLFMAVFNLIPAFPMDGGRILRALLAMRLDYVKATHWAANVGQALAVVGGWWALSHQLYILVLIAVFVWIGAEREAEDVSYRSKFANLRAADAMITKFSTVSPQDPVQNAVQIILHSWQPDFPVTEEGQLVGILTRRDLAALMSQNPAAEVLVGALMRPHPPTCGPGEPLEDCIDRMHQSDLPILPVVEDGRLCGLLSQENVDEYLALARRLRPASV